MISTKQWGGILLITGTAIGGGMLALPLATAKIGFINALMLLVVCWLIMTIGALYILEVSLSMPPHANIISMAKSTLGLPGLIVAWLSYLLLLYALLSAYIAGGSDVLHALLLKININVSQKIAAVIFTAIFANIVYAGIRAVDYTNRVFMIAKLSIYALLVVIIFPKIDYSFLSNGDIKEFPSCLMILITSFGFATIIPSMRYYFKDEPHNLKKLVMIGSIIPLVCYIAWIAVIMGVVPRVGEHGLIALSARQNPNSGLITQLFYAVKSTWVDKAFTVFTSICMVTAFLNVSLGLYDFLADGLKLKKTGCSGFIIFLLTFLPGLTIVLFNPGIYLHALSYAGICCIVLLLLLPCFMVWSSRRQNKNHLENSIVPAGNILICTMIMIGIFLLFFAY